MNTLLEITEVRTRRLRIVDTGAEPRSNDVMAIHTGLSVTVCGHLIRLRRDERHQRAEVVVQVLDGHTITGLEVEAVKAAADMLRQRAQRFLGAGWTVAPWRCSSRITGVGA